MNELWKERAIKEKNGKLIEFSRYVEIQAIPLKLLLFRVMAFVKDKIVINICNDQEDWQVSFIALIPVQSTMNPSLTIRWK